MNKTITYGNSTFNIKVELNVSVERHPHGKQFSTITVNEVNRPGYWTSRTVDNDSLINTINSLEEEIKKYAEGKYKNNLSFIEVQLINMGFNKN